MSISLKQIDEAKALLKSVGYFTDNLWHIDDVKMNFDCTDEEAMDVLNDTLTGEYMTEATYDLIKIVANQNNLKPL